MIPYRRKNMYLSKRDAPIVKIAQILCFITLHLSKTSEDTPERHDFWEMVYLESGEAMACSAHTQVKLLPGDVLLHKPGQAHSIQAISPTIKAFFISFHSTSKILNTLHSQRLSLSADQRKFIYKIYDEARELFINQAPQIDRNGFMSVGFKEDPPLAAEQVIQNYLELLLIGIFRTLEKQEEIITYHSKAELENLLYQKMVEKIADFIYSDFSADDLVAELNYSRTYVYSVFTKYAGVPIMQYYNQLKIEEAKKLIAQKQFTLAQISEKLCFKNQYYFSRTFKRIQGVSPSAYRNQVNTQ